MTMDNLSNSQQVAAERLLAASDATLELLEEAERLARTVWSSTEPTPEVVTRIAQLIHANMPEIAPL